MSQEVKENREHEEANLNLIDCYRVALDFGLPVAEKAIDNLLIAFPGTGSDKNADGLAKEISVSLPG